MTHQMDGFLDEEEGYESPESEPEQTDYVKWARDLGLAPPTSESDAESGAKESNLEQASEIIGAKAPKYTGPDTSICDQFQEYCENAKKNLSELSEDEIVAIRLLQVLKLKQSPKNAYEPLMKWHLQSSKKLVSLSATSTVQKTVRSTVCS
jgi:hypothetical protein